MSGDIDAESLPAALEPFKYNIGTEVDLQDGIERVLASKLIPFQREFALTSADRPDFLVDGHIALEVKIKGSIAQLLRQVDRYAKHPTISAIVVIGTPAWISTLPSEVGGKPLYKLRLMYSFF